MHVTADTRQTQSRSGRPDRQAVLRAAAELVLVAAIALVGARAIWFAAYGGDVERLEIAPSAQMSPRAGEAGRADLSALIRADLFGERAFAGEPAEAEAPETRLDLTLRGVRQGGTPQTGSAIIQAPQTGQRTLPVGAEIAPNVTLEAVYADRVIIARAGMRESLFLREQSAREPRLLRQAGAAPEPVENTATPEPAPAAFSEEDWVRGLRLARAEAEGQAIGYRIEASSDPALLAATGLEAGDIIVSVNGRRLDRPVNTLEVLEELAEASRAEFVLLRGGQSRTIEVNLR